MEKSVKYQENRKRLKEQSKLVKPLIECGEYNSVNEALKEAVIFEQNPEITKLNTFEQWKKQGFSVKKGEKAFLVWGSPRTIPQDEENDEFKYWPICYLFGNTQVEKTKVREVSHA